MSKFYDDAQKWQLYVRHRRGRTLTQLQDETGITDKPLRAWFRAFDAQLSCPDNQDLLRLQEEYDRFGLANHAVIVDCNHSNSGKKYLEQIRIAGDVLHSRRLQPSLRRLVKGLMIESYLEDGCQKVEEGVYGKSITDPCLGWEKTERLILDIADQL